MLLQGCNKVVTRLWKLNNLVVALLQPCHNYYYTTMLQPCRVDSRLSEPRLSEPSIIRIQKQMKIIGSKFKKLLLHHH